MKLAGRYLTNISFLSLSTHGPPQSAIPPEIQREMFLYDLTILYMLGISAAPIALTSWKF